MKTKLFGRFWLCLTLFSLMGQIAWVVENMYFNVFVYKMFHATAGECLIIFIGIIGLGTIVYTVWGRGKLGTYDWIVIIFSIFLGSCLLGF